MAGHHVRHPRSQTKTAPPVPLDRVKPNAAGIDLETGQLMEPEVS